MLQAADSAIREGDVWAVQQHFQAQQESAFNELEGYDSTRVLLELFGPGLLANIFGFHKEDRNKKRDISLVYVLIKDIKFSSSCHQAT